MHEKKSGQDITPKKEKKKKSCNCSKLGKKKKQKKKKERDSLNESTHYAKAFTLLYIEIRFEQNLYTVS